MTKMVAMPIYGKNHKKVFFWTGGPRRNISIGIPLHLSIPTEMTSIEPLDENAKLSKIPKKLKIMLCYIYSD